MGDPRNPMTPEQLENKFDALSKEFLSADSSQRVKDAIGTADAAPTIRELMRAFVADS